MRFTMFFFRKKLLPGIALFSILLLAPLSNSRAAQVDPQVESALKKAYGGDLAGCEQELNNIAKTGDKDILVLWNLAAVQTRQDRLGHALHSLMMLIKENPPGKMKVRALELRESILSRLIERARQEGDPNLFALHDPRSLVDKWLGLFPAPLWRWIAYTLFWLGILGWFLRNYGPAGGRLAFTALAITFFMGGSIATTSDLMVRNSGENSRLGITVQAQTLFKEGLVDGAPTRNLPEGVVLQVVDQVTEKLVQVQLGDGREGFMTAQDLAIVE